jgi:myo-inositol-1-phosphate synthase
MNNRRVGIWLIGACGGVGTTAVLGLSALIRRLIDDTGMVTALPLFDGLNLDKAGQFVVGGHDVRRSSFVESARELHERSNVFNRDLIQECLPDLEAWTSHIRPGTIHNAGQTIGKLADLPEAQRSEGPRQAIGRIQKDLQDFRTSQRLEQVVVINVASTEPPFALDDSHSSRKRMLSVLEKQPNLLPASSLYAWAALDLGCPYINFTPSLGASFPAGLELAQERKAVTGGKDGKTGETLLKSVLAPMFAHRNLRILSWVGHNIFGNRDGLVLDDPKNKESKIRTKDQVISQIVGYKPQTHVSIEYIQSLDDWKTAWDHIHFRGFLGVKMMMQFTWQGCDSLLAAPLVLDLARLALHAQRQGEVGMLKHLACFFKSPMGVDEHDFHKQWAMLENYIHSQATA